ncbi:DUF3696 domain-containing protein [Corynebacterium glyciniphilum]|uniref:DUF3696 domain-containing protein n=1 Tax=Corynebacterium glyciniphilum TaxID=1404244 RepID=UPI003FD493DA
MFWTVENFKSIKKASLDLKDGGVTLLAGVNSSGKSSLIQSLLLAAQSSYHSGGFVLNGPLVRLGAASELVREKSVNPLSLALSDETTISKTGNNSRGKRISRKRYTQAYSAKFQCSPSGASELSISNLTISDPENNATGELSASNDYARKSDAETATHALGLDESSGGSLLHVKSTFEGDAHPRRTFIYVDGLRPTHMVQVLSQEGIAKLYQKKAEETLVNRIGETGVGRTAYRTYGVDFEALWDIGERLSDYAESQGGSLDEITQRIVTKTQNSIFPKVWDELDVPEKRRAIEIAAEVRARDNCCIIVSFGIFRPGSEIIPEGLLESSLMSDVGLSGQLLRAVASSVLGLGNRINYLGPLRDEPRVAWEQWNELTRGLPVGIRGEYCASQLNRSGSKTVHFIDLDGSERHENLTDACNYWLNYLEMGHSVLARDLGKTGTGLEIIVDGSPRDLTSLGVGVSQALPIIVALLLIPQNSLFCIEQPELHLHPDVQARLGDFLAFARPDVHCMIETHSDSLLTRLRRRVSEKVVDPEQISLVFVEKEDGGSDYRTLEMDDVGNLKVWPKGFLTGALEDSQVIIREAMERRRRGDRK